jgi:protein TonB
MFADSLLESHFDHTHRGWTTFASFGLQMLGVAVLLMLPLIYTEGLPKMHLLSPIGPPPGRPPAAQQHSGIRHGESNMFHDTVVIPPSIPIGVTEVHDESLPQDAPPCDICVPYSTGLSSSTNSIANSIGTSTTIVPPPPTPTARPPRISHMMEGNLIYRVQPIYPPLARSARIQGQVLLRAIISRTGTIENLQTISGHPMLVGAAVDAVRQWRYRPYILNGEPVEVETQVTVNFSLSGG